MKKKVFLAAVLFALMAVGAFAQAYNAESDFQVTSSGRAIRITGYVGTATVVNIPPRIQNLPVTAIGDRAFMGNNRITSVTIPDSVDTIGLMAFNSCGGLLSVTIGGQIMRGNFHELSFDGSLYALYYAANAASGTPGTYTRVRDGQPWTLTPAASSQKEGTTPEGICWQLTVDERGIEIFEYTGTATAVRIPDRINNLPVTLILGAFEGNQTVTSVVIPNTVTRIGSRSFAGATKLTSVTLPASLTGIEDSTFYGCTALTTINLPASVHTIMSSAFRGCTALTTVSLPASIMNIGARAFQDCRALTTVTIPASVTSITFGAANVFSGAANVNAASKTALQRVGYTGSF